jgi:hypothetical protein
MDGGGFVAVVESRASPPGLLRLLTGNPAGMILTAS